MIISKIAKDRVWMLVICVVFAFNSEKAHARGKTFIIGGVGYGISKKNNLSDLNIQPAGLSYLVQAAFMGRYAGALISQSTSTFENKIVHNSIDGNLVVENSSLGFGININLSKRIFYQVMYTSNKVSIKIEDESLYSASEVSAIESQYELFENGSASGIVNGLGLNLTLGKTFSLVSLLHYHVISKLEIQEYLAYAGVKVVF